MTLADAVLWEQLRDRRLGGLKFCRQHPIEVEIEGTERFVIADFFCHALRLVVEVDGSSHRGREVQDTARTKDLETIGLRVLRFSNAEVLHDVDSVLRTIGGCTLQDRGNARPEPDTLPLPSRGKGERGG
jgi:very-short-patch-repair endonuclease